MVRQYQLPLLVITIVRNKIDHWWSTEFGGTVFINSAKFLKRIFGRVKCYGHGCTRSDDIILKDLVNSISWQTSKKIV